jgi:hypothetical protein
MDGAELFGKVIRCNIAKPMTKIQAGKAVWSAEEWYKTSLPENDSASISAGPDANSTQLL